MSSKKERILIFVLLLISVSSFFLFGLYHLGKFETTDEHLWKYQRIGQYWEAIGDGNLEKTYINDKPGITVALISGMGLLSEPSPENNEKIDSHNILFENYNYQQSEITNLRFRLPILIFSTLSLFAFFYLILQAFNSYRTALLGTILIATNPILIGISQIINPDSFFWIFGGLSILSYLSYLNKKSSKFLILCGILTGLALLSKYTAFILFAFFVTAAFFKIIFQNKDESLKTNWKTALKHLFDIFFIFIISVVVFSVLLPAVFINPTYLFKGISQFISFKTFFLASLIIALFAGLITYKKDIIGKIVYQISKQKRIIVTISLILLSFLLIISLINTWTGQKFSPVNQLRDLAYINEPKEFNFKPLLDRKDESLINIGKLILMEAYPFTFSISPILIFLLFLITTLSFKGKISEKNNLILFSGSIFILIYFISTFLAHIVTNARYSIILYPLIDIMGAVTILELLNLLKLKKIKIIIILSTLLLAWGITLSFQIKPFYFSYTNSFLPQKYTIHDSWGHGAYEAAQYLNSLPDSQNLIIYSNSETVCRFFKGKCLKSRKIDLNLVKPDYLIFSKRGVLKEKNHIVLINNPYPDKNAQYYFKKLDRDYIWQILVDNHPDNFIKIIKFEK